MSHPDYTCPSISPRSAICVLQYIHTHVQTHVTRANDSNDTLAESLLYPPVRSVFGVLSSNIHTSALSIIQTLQIYINPHWHLLDAISINISCYRVQCRSIFLGSHQHRLFEITSQISEISRIYSTQYTKPINAYR